MKVLSLFDGMSCTQLALDAMGVKVDKYYSSEIDKPAIEQTQANYPNTIQLGSVTHVKIKGSVNKEDQEILESEGYIFIEPVDLVVGGSPCQGFSFAGKQLNFNDPRSKLFFEFVRLVNENAEQNPNAKFLLENVNMKKRYMAVISEYLKVLPVNINSNLVSAQNRNRWYWTNIKTKAYGMFKEQRVTDIPQPKDKGIFIEDILEDEVDDKYYMTTKALKGYLKHKARHDDKGNGFGIEIKSRKNKANCISTREGGRNTSTFILETDDLYTIISEALANGEILDDLSILIPEATEKGYVEIKPGGCFDAEQPNSKTRRGRDMSLKSNCLMAAQNSFLRFTKDYKIRRLTPRECMRLQTIPETYRQVVSDTQMYKMLGNGFTRDVIIHILSFMNLKTP